MEPQIYPWNSRLLETNFSSIDYPEYIFTFDPIDNTTGTFDYTRWRWELLNLNMELPSTSTYPSYDFSPEDLEDLIEGLSYDEKNFNPDRDDIDGDDSGPEYEWKLFDEDDIPFW